MFLKFFTCLIIVNELSIKLIANANELKASTCTQADDYSGVAEECDKFLRCSNGLFFEFRCAPGTLFDFKRKICDFPQNVICMPSQFKSTTWLEPTTRRCNLIRFFWLNAKYLFLLIFK